MKKTALLALFATALVVTLASAARATPSILYVTDFNSAAAGHTGNFATSANYSDGAIIGQDSWAITGTSVVSPINVANTATNGNVTLTTTGQDVNRQLTQAPITGGQVYLSADINVTAAAAGGDYFLHLDDGTTTGFSDRIFVKSSGAGFVMALGTGSGTTPTYGATVLNLNQTYHVVAEYDFVGGGTTNDTGNLYLNPTDPIYGDTPASPSFYVQATTQGTDATQIAGVNLRQGTTGSAPNVIVDNVAVAVPEPTSLACAVLGAIGLIGLARRKFV